MANCELAAKGKNLDEGMPTLFLSGCHSISASPLKDLREPSIEDSKDHVETWIKENHADNDDVKFGLELA